MKTMRLQVGQLLTVTAPPISGGTFYTNNPNAGSPFTVAASESLSVGPFNTGTRWAINDGLTAVKSDYDYVSTRSSGWRDLRLALVGAAKGAGSPTLAAFGPSGSGAVKQMKMGIGDSLYATGHIDHDYKVNSIVYPHVHWSTGGTSTASVKWQFTCVSAIGHN